MLRHEWNLTPKEAVQLQRELACRVRPTPLEGPIRTVAGVDCAYVGARGRNLSAAKEVIAAAVLCDAETMEVVEHSCIRRPCTFPYVPGLLSFREAPAAIAAVKSLHTPPDLLMCDGQGVAHPRGLGLAAHVGLWLDVPTIGVAKSRLCGEHAEPGLRRGGRKPLELDGRTVGAVLRTRDGVRPLYISVGHRITLDEAVEWVLRAGRGVRLPQPTRLADRFVSRCR